MKLSEYLETTEVTQHKFAETVGVTQGAVSQWLKSGVPAKRILSVENATNGLVTRYELLNALGQE